MGLRELLTRRKGIPAFQRKRRSLQLKVDILQFLHKL